MLNRICVKDGIGLVNVVRSEHQEQLLRSQGAKYVVNSMSPTFSKGLTDAIAATGATIAFDAIGGGTLGGQILGCMEAALARAAKGYLHYGSTTHKQLYIYGALDRSPTELSRNFGFAWGVGGWLLTPFLQSAGAETVARLRARVAAEIRTTFASHYTRCGLAAPGTRSRGDRGVRPAGTRAAVPDQPGAGLSAKPRRKTP